VGALVSAISLALRKTVRGLTTMIQVSAAVFGAGLIGFSFSRVFLLSLFLMLFVGFGMMQGWRPATQSFKRWCRRQTRPRHELLHHGLRRHGSVGSLLAGSLAHHFGAPRAVMISGAFCVAAQRGSRRN